MYLLYYIDLKKALLSCE